MFLFQVKEYELSRSFKPSIPNLRNTKYSVDTPAADQAYNEIKKSTKKNKLKESNDVVRTESNDVLPVSEPHVILNSRKSSASKDKQALLNSIVTNYSKKYYKNRRGRKMGKGRKGKKNKKGKKDKYFLTFFLNKNNIILLTF